MNPNCSGRIPQQSGLKVSTSAKIPIAISSNVLIVIINFVGFCNQYQNLMVLHFITIVNKKEVYNTIELY